MSRLVTLRCALLAIAITQATACVRVKPYEREQHAKPAMQDQSENETKLDSHVNEYREGSVGGDGAGGGGCGCN